MRINIFFTFGPPLPHPFTLLHSLTVFLFIWFIWLFYFPTCDLQQMKSVSKTYILFFFLKKKSYTIHNMNLHNINLKKVTFIIN